MHAVLADFRTKLQLGDTIFLYFFGFAVSYGGKNYLLPADMPQLVRKRDVAQFGIDIDSTLEMLNDAVGDNGIKIAILEASAPVQFCHRGGKALQGIDINASGGNMFIQVCTAESEPAPLSGAQSDSAYLYTVIAQAHWVRPFMSFRRWESWREKYAELSDNVPLTPSSSSSSTLYPWTSSTLITDFYFEGELDREREASGRPRVTVRRRN